MTTLQHARHPARKPSDERDSDPQRPSRDRNDSIASEAERVRAERSSGKSESIDDEIEGAMGVPVSKESVSLSIHIGPNQVLFEEGANTVRSGPKGSQLWVKVTEWGVLFDSQPPLVIYHDSPGLTPDAEVNFHAFSWNFGGDVRAEASANPIVEFFADPQSEITSALTKLVGGLPARMHTADYDPFQDDALLGDLQSAFSGPTAGPQADGPLDDVNTSRASIRGGFVLDEDFVTEGGGDANIRLAAGTRLNMSVAAAGGIPDDLADLAIDSVDIDCTGDVMVQLLGEDIAPITITGIHLDSGGAVTFDYSLITEDISDVARLLGALIGANAERRPPRDVRPARHEAIRARIDEILEEQGAAAIRRLICENALAIPGVDLAKALGLSG